MYQQLTCCIVLYRDVLDVFLMYQITRLRDRDRVMIGNELNLMY